ncbi:MAG: hypothetical protein HEQ17_03905 [Limnohabitans sp.]|jgi:hypothetical protein|uniref:hypothetical protein n=1 Tax=Limnohabitans sp. TaxID=1907725 RepID=UPI0025E233AB|nr:hypothetical protein [Limnohabitans sp.]MCO4088127.1 hypothetical protein [Limnohabitans sp.]
MNAGKTLFAQVMEFVPWKKGPAVGDVPSAITPTGVALSLLLLSAQVFSTARCQGQVARAHRQHSCGCKM